MNVALSQTTEDLPPRRAFTVEDVRRMVETGVILEDERIELIGGDLFVMAAKGYSHEIVKKALVRAVVQTAPDDADIGIEMTIQFSQDILLEPDIAVFPRRYLKKSDAGFIALDRGECSLVIEVAASSLSYDKKVKAPLYAELGVQEFWVVDANERITWIHSGPVDNGWTSIVERGANEPLTTPALPNFSLRLADID
jgi:Uma2 family endonuclease